MINSIITYGNIRITLNDLTNLHSHYKFDIIRQDNAVVRQSKDYLPGDDEVKFFRLNLGERLIQLQGYVRGATEADLYEKIETLKEAFHPVGVQTDVSGTDGFLPLKWTDAGRAAKMYLAKPLKLTDVSEGYGSGFERNFIIYLETFSPYALGQTSRSYTLAPTTGAGGTGGAIPATIPMIVAGGSSYYGSQTVTNAGDIPANIIATFNNQITAPKITNTTTGESVEFTSDVAMVAGDSLVIDFKNATAWLTSAGTLTNVIKYLTAGSRFFKIGSGTSVLTLTGDSLASTVTCVVTYYDTYSS